jgi:hypothetical protein
LQRQWDKKLVAAQVFFRQSRDKKAGLLPGFFANVGTMQAKQS